MIISLKLSMEVMFDVYRQQILYLNRCVDESSSKDLRYPGATEPFLL